MDAEPVSITESFGPSHQTTSLGEEAVHKGLSGLPEMVRNFLDVAQDANGRQWTVQKQRQQSSFWMQIYNQSGNNQPISGWITHTHTPGDEYLGIGMAHLGVTLGPPAADRTVAVHFERPSCYPNLRSGKAASARKESNLLDTNLTRNTSFHHLLTPLFSSQTPLTEKHVSNIWNTVSKIAFLLLKPPERFHHVWNRDFNNNR